MEHSDWFLSGQKPAGCRSDKNQSQSSISHTMEYLAAPESKIELAALMVDGPARDVFRDENDAKFFEAVEEEDLALIQSILNDNSTRVNINAINSEGLTALQIAVDKKRLDIVKELLQKGADLQTALLQAVFDNDLECVEVLLTTKKSEDEDTVKPRDTSYITPITLAAQMGYYEMIHLLLKNDQIIELPHATCCNCDVCSTTSAMLRSKIAINRFRGLASPDYMCLLYMIEKCGKKDPLTQAFELNKLVEKRADDEPELKKEYLQLSASCKRFSVELYNECRSTREIAALLDIDEDLNLSCTTKISEESRENMTKTFRSAIECDHKEFIAHPHTQQLLNTVVYSDSKWHTRSFLYRFTAFLIYTLIFPSFVAIYIILPDHKVSRLMRTPYMKFVSHLSQFVLFLGFLAASALRDNHIPTALEYLIFLCVVGMIVQEFVEMLAHRPRRSYFFKWWNIIMTVMLTLFVVAALLWIIGFAITGGWSVVEFSEFKFTLKTGHRLLLLGNSFFSLAIVVSVFHLVDLCQVSSVLGPLQLSLYRMLRDVIKFLMIFFAIFMAFVFGLRNLYSYYNSVQAEISKHYRNKNITGQTDHPLSTFSESTQSMFWALFDKIDLDDFNTKKDTFSITQETGKLLFAFYSICAVMVALNMLIAMMTHSYEYISQDGDIQWKFSRTQLWLEFVEKGSTLPSPYNLIPNPWLIYRIFKRKFRTRRPTFTTQNSVAEDERKKIIKHLVRRYFLKRESQRKKKPSTFEDIERIVNLK